MAVSCSLESRQQLHIDPELPIHTVYFQDGPMYLGPLPEADVTCIALP